MVDNWGGGWHIYIYRYIDMVLPPMNPRLVMVIWSSPTKAVLLAFW